MQGKHSCIIFFKILLRRSIARQTSKILLRFPTAIRSEISSGSMPCATSLLASSSPPNAPLLFIPARLCRKDIHFVPCTSFSEFQYLLAVQAALIYAVRRARVPLSFIFSRALPQKSSTYVHEPSVRPSRKVSNSSGAARQLFRGLLKTAVSTCPPLGFPGVSYVGEKFGRIHSRARDARALPFLLALLDHVHHPLRVHLPRLASFRPFRSVSDALFRLTFATHPRALGLSLDRS